MAPVYNTVMMFGSFNPSPYVITVVSSHILLAFHIILLPELYFGEQLWLQTAEVKLKLHTDPQSDMLMKRFRINRGEERPTL